MDPINFFLFGRFEVACAGERLSIDGQKARELLCYLLMRPERAHSRERLTTLLWPDSSAAQARQYLRQTLYKVQVSARRWSCPVDPLLLVENEWVRLNPELNITSDVARLEAAVRELPELGDRPLTAGEVALLCDAIGAYRGDFLENWYQEWCLPIRDRLQTDYLALIHRLMTQCEADATFEQGLDLGARALRIDAACEKTHRHLMRLRHLAGDRTGALRQYDRCVTALADELDVPPGHLTERLREAIRADSPLPGAPAEHLLPGVDVHEALGEFANRLDKLQAMLRDVKRQMDAQLPAMPRNDRPRAVSARTRLRQPTNGARPPMIQSQGPVL